ncbi:dihydrofolate reductase family protein, partial [Staphylococcus epidermidis]|uniref:dihydrofolate reductase family protein n=1 Tax=Staphylococcus epidermidis TaxID=1282 RepID=UPI0021B233F5
MVVEGGGNISWEFVELKDVNEVILYIGGKLIGGCGKDEFYKSEEVIDLGEGTEFEIVDWKLINE